MSAPVRSRLSAAHPAKQSSKEYSPENRASQELAMLAAIVESSDDAILSENLKGIIQTWNPSAERLFGFSVAEIIGQPITTIIPTERTSEEKRFFSRIRRGLRVDHFETVRRCKDGRLVEVSLSLSPVRDQHGRIIGAAKIARSIGERNRQNRALIDSEARTAAVIETAVDAIIVIDERGRIDSINPATQQLFGYLPGELLGQNVNMLMPEPYRSEHDGYLSTYAKTGIARIIGIGRDVIGQRKDGTTFPMALAVSEMRLGDRRMYTGIVHDLTARRLLEREVLDATTNEQRRIGQDLHDGICQELVSLSMGAELLAQRLDAASPRDAAAARRLGDEVQAAAEQARRLSHGLNPIDVEAGGLPGALEQLARRVNDSTGIRCHFKCDVSQRGHPKTDVATHLYRIAQEAVGNAVKHSRARRMGIDLRLAKGTLTLQMTDDGTGFDSAGGGRNRKPHAGPSMNANGKGDGIGLRTMSYRARVIGGDLRIGPGRRGGTVVTCSLRLPPATV